MISFYLGLAFMASFGFEHNLYIFGSDLGTTYSDMNGYGRSLLPYALFKAYWGSFSLMLAIVTLLLWVRGNEDSWRMRLRIFRQRLGRTHIETGAAALLVFLGTGAFIFYNTNILHEYKATKREQTEAAEYEKLYKIYKSAPQPRYTAVYAIVDIYPKEQRLRINARFQIKNKSSEPLSEIYLNLPDELEIRSLEFSRASKVNLADRKHRFYIHRLNAPMAPQETMEMNFSAVWEQRGFKNSNNRYLVLDNGTFFNDMNIFPVIGYASFRELANDDARKKQGLAPKDRMAPVDDKRARQNTVFRDDAGWVSYEAILSTSLDQLAVTPGYLQREWREGNRRYFHYKMDRPLLDFFAFLSARYEVRRAKWNDVNLEIYYHRGHEYNVDEMIRSLQESLDYFTKNFGPYQHRQVRILEFPRYASFAQSYANTIPYSESVGFIAKVKPDTIDYPFYITSHELAHQWWGHQVIGANVQGATLMSEVLAQYSSLQVMRREFGEKKTRKYLTYELDLYLAGRSQERKREMPLARVENQGYIHYNKGMLVMNALQDYIGEDRINAALARCVQERAFQEAPFLNSVEFLEYFRNVTPPEYQYLLTDLFETITLYDNKASKATYRRLPGGKFKVKVKVEGRKLRADGLGKESEIPLNDWLDVGVLDKNDEAIILQRVKMEEASREFIFVVDRLPARAGIDPYKKLIDRKSDDNTMPVEEIR
jgi:ABC-2 type transport system permease protein